MRARPLSCLVLAALSLSTVAHADEAAKRFERGLADMLAGRYATGCPLILESHQLAAKPGTLFTLAECYRKAGKIASAVTRYTEYLNLYEGLPRAQKRVQRERAEVSSRDRAQLLEVVPRLVLVLPEDAPAGTVVTKDNVVLERDALDKPMLVDPGEHVFVTQAPGGPAIEQRTSIRRGEQQRIELVVGATSESQDVAPTPAEGAGAASPPPDSPAGPAPAEADSAKPDEGRSQRTWGYVLGGIGLAGLAAGSVSGVIVLSERRVILEDCVRNECGPDGLKAADRAETFGLVSTIGFAVGLTGVATAAILLLTDDSSDRERQRPGRLRPFVAGAGPRDAAIGLSGAF